MSGDIKREGGGDGKDMVRGEKEAGRRSRQ